MRNDMFFCRDCGDMFDTPSSYEERHGLDLAPYESVAICPHCGSDNFSEFESSVEIIEIAEHMVPMILGLNKYVNELENLYGTEIKNSNLLDCIDSSTEFLADLFDFMDIDLQRKLLKMKNENEADKMLMRLRGEV